jgi:hypothetical protein
VKEMDVERKKINNEKMIRATNHQGRFRRIHVEDKENIGVEKYAENAYHEKQTVCLGSGTAKHCQDGKPQKAA